MHFSAVPCLYYFIARRPIRVSTAVIRIGTFSGLYGSPQQRFATVCCGTPRQKRIMFTRALQVCSGSFLRMVAKLRNRTILKTDVSRFLENFIVLTKSTNSPTSDSSGQNLASSWTTKPKLTDNLRMTRFPKHIFHYMLCVNGLSQDIPH